MRIAEISTFSTFSVGTIMQNIKSYCLENGHDCKIFFARGKAVSIDDIQFQNNFQTNINALESRIFDNDGFCLTSGMAKLFSELEQFNPQIIHIHCLHGYSMNIKQLFHYFVEKKVKVVWTLHDTWAMTGHCCYFDKINCSKWKSTCHSCGLKKDYPKSLMIDNSKHNFLKKKHLYETISSNDLIVVTPSIWLKDIASQSILSRFKTVVINNGIDLSKFNKPLKRQENKKHILLGVASVWDYRKGLDVFVSLSKALSEDWEIVIIGKVYDKSLLPSNIKYLERTASVDVLKQYYQQCDLFFNPTRSENYPTVNLEAQVCGAKVLCFDVGGCKETQLGNLHLIDQNCKINDLVEAIYSIAQLKNNNIDEVKASKDTMSSNYLKLFLELANKEKAL